MRRNQSGFTLFEVILAIVIGLMFMLIALPSIGSLFTERRLLERYEAFDEFVRAGRLKAVQEQRNYVVIFEEAGVSIEPDEVTDDDDQGGAPESYSLGEGSTLTIERPAALEKKPPAEWF